MITMAIKETEPTKLITAARTSNTDAVPNIPGVRGEMLGPVLKDAQLGDPQMGSVTVDPPGPYTAVECNVAWTLPLCIKAGRAATAF
jgi:hypothetical protein